MTTTLAPGLYLVSTPIGNLGDLSPRARETLAGADLLLAEDTRTLARLLSASGIAAPPRAVSLRRENEPGRIPEVLALLSQGKRVAYASDAGTPGICDPPARLVRAAGDAGHAVRCVPGPSALAAAVAISGLVEGPFRFAGFLPARGSERTRALAEIARTPEAVVLFEAPHRIERLLEDLETAMPERPLALCREMTKIHEEVRFGRPAELRKGLTARGEFAVVLAPIARRDDAEGIEMESHAGAREAPRAFAEGAAAAGGPNARLSGIARMLTDKYGLSHRESRRIAEAACRVAVCAGTGKDLPFPK